MRRLLALLLVVAVVPALAAPAAAGARRDRSAPKVSFTTDSGAVRLGGVPERHELTTVAGRASDDVSGVRSVQLLYCPGEFQSGGGWVCSTVYVGGGVGGLKSVAATLSCRSRGRSCTWDAAVPLEPGKYVVFALAKDRKGRERASRPIELVVL